MKPLMKCGHVANGADKNDQPVCVMCIGLNTGADVVDDRQLNLDGREARCRYARVGKYGCATGELRGDRHGYRPSSLSLPFFGSCPDKEFDEYYCGCWGWD